MDIFVKKAVILSILAITALLSACSSKPAKNADATTKTEAKTAESQAPQYDTEKPTNFSEYKEWRKKNDPASEAYAEYKEWEINFRRWKALQEQ